MAVKVQSNIQWGHPILETQTDYYRTSSTSTAVNKNPVRFAGWYVNGYSASAGNTFKFKIIDGSTSAGTVVLLLSAGSVSVRTPYQWPFTRLRNGLFIDVSADASSSASVVPGITVFYVEDAD